ncbi:asparagine-rich antigen, putative [Plasmodium chabaudi chabaudi]|uniref:Asparagine-rich antigen, putative n=1 Tax=Plasmodium chabaudi chabaudi TaxID=31271 RepID=A0A4V0K2S9_PLACU|nr:asparagine-rich antigen, putative [Plasmodium chabaudi chabaudi]VTZ66838.1 asparagine-rich antigen, putative [Plasmodium chabaudi chabaudi]|eukprot:XP_737457.2 asparagine-rich antigen, putative [Plasmodium chabaudi chabaudi]
MHNFRAKESKHNKNKENLNGLYYTPNSENHMKTNKEKPFHSSNNNYKYIRDNQNNLVDYLSYNNYTFSNCNGNYNSRKMYYNKNMNNRYHKMHYNNENEQDYIGRSKNYNNNNNNNNNIFKDGIGYEKFNRRNNQNNNNWYYNNVDNTNEYKTMGNELLPSKHKNEFDKSQINVTAENELNNKKFKDIDKKNSHQNMMKKGNNRVRKNNFISSVPPQNNDNGCNVENQIIPPENENIFVEKKKKNYTRYKNNCKNNYSYNSNNNKGHTYFNESYNNPGNYNYTRYNNDTGNNSFSYRNNHVNSGYTKSRNSTSNYNAPNIIGKNIASKSENIKCDTPSNIKFNGNIYNATSNSNDYNLCINGYNNTKNSFDLFVNSKKNMLDDVGVNSEVCCDKDKSMGFDLNKNNANCQNKEQNNDAEKNEKNNMTAQNEPIWDTFDYQKDKIDIQTSEECVTEKTNTIAKLDENVAKGVQTNSGNNNGSNSRNSYNYTQTNINSNCQYPDANHEENGNDSKFVFNKNNYGKKNTPIKYYNNSYNFNYRNNINTRYFRRKHISYDNNSGSYNTNYYYKKLGIDCKASEAYKDRENCTMDLGFIDEKDKKLENNKVDIKVLENGDINVLDDNICNSKLKDNELVINEKKGQVSKNQYSDSYNSNNNKQNNVNTINEPNEHENEKEEGIKVNILPQSTKSIECQLEKISKNAPILANNGEENGNQNNSPINMDDNICVSTLKNNNTSLYNLNKRKNSKFYKNKMDIARMKNISLNTNKKQNEMNPIKIDTLDISENKCNDNDALFLEKNDDTNNGKGIFTICSGIGNDYTVFDINKESTQSTTMICSSDGKSALNKTEEPRIQFGCVGNESVNTFFNKPASINNSNVSVGSKKLGSIQNETLNCYKSELPYFKENNVCYRTGKKNINSYTNKSCCSLVKSGDNFVGMKKKEVIYANEKKRKNRKKRKNILKNVKNITSNNEPKSNKTNKTLSFPKMRDNNVGENEICDGTEITQRQRSMHNRSQSESIYNCKDNYIKNLEVSMTKPHMSNCMQSVNDEKFRAILNKYIFNCDSNINDEETLFSCDDEAEKTILDKYVHKEIGQTELKISLPHVMTCSSSINNNLENPKEVSYRYNVKPDKCAPNYESSTQSNVAYAANTAPHFDNPISYENKCGGSIINKHTSLKKAEDLISRTLYNFNGEFNCGYTVKTQNTFLSIYNEEQNLGEKKYKINNKSNINEKDTTHFDLVSICSDAKTKRTALKMKKCVNSIDAKVCEKDDIISHREYSENRKNNNDLPQQCHNKEDLSINCDRDNNISFMIDDMNDSHHQKKSNSKKSNISYSEKDCLKKCLAIESESIDKNMAYMNNTDINRVNNGYAENPENKKNMNVNNNIYLKNSQNNSNTNNVNYCNNIGIDFNTNLYYNKFSNVANSNTNGNKSWEGKHSSQYIGAASFPGDPLNTHNFDTHKETNNKTNNESDPMYISPYAGNGGNNNFCNNYNFNSSTNFGSCDNYTNAPYSCNTTSYYYKSYNYSAEGNSNSKNVNNRYYEVNKNVCNSSGSVNKTHLNNMNQNGDQENSGYFFNTKCSGINNYENVASTSAFIGNDNYINHNKSSNNGSGTNFHRNSRGNGNDMNCTAKYGGKGNSINYGHDNYTKNWNGTFNYRNNYKMKTNYRFDNNYMDIRRKYSPNNMKKNVKKIWINHKNTDEGEEKHPIVKKYNIYNSFTNMESNKDANDNRAITTSRETKNEKLNYNKQRDEKNDCKGIENEANTMEPNIGSNMPKDVVSNMVNEVSTGESNFKESNFKESNKKEVKNGTETYSRNRKYGNMINNNYKKNLIKKNRSDGRNSSNITINEGDNLMMHKNGKDNCTNKKVGIDSGNMDNWQCYRNGNADANNSPYVGAKKSNKGYSFYNKKTYFKQNSKKNGNVLFNNDSYVISNGKNCSPLSKNNKSNNNNGNFLKKNDNVKILDEEKQKVDGGCSGSVMEQKRDSNVGMEDNESYLNENTLCNNKVTICPDKFSQSSINGYANNIEMHGSFCKGSYNRKNSFNKNDNSIDNFTGKKV